MIIETPDAQLLTSVAVAGAREVTSHAIQAKRVARRRLRRFAAAFGAFAWIVVIWSLMVNTRIGQVLDSVAMLSSRGVAWLFAGFDLALLSTVSVGMLVITMFMAAVIAVIRQRWQLGLRAALVIAISAVTTQVIKGYVLFRPALLPGYVSANSLPSGHTTAAAAAATALVLVVPLAWRPVTAIFGVAVTVLVGFSTVVNHWHRPSDVVAAIFVVMMWTLILAPVESRRGKRSDVARHLSFLGVFTGIFSIGLVAASAWMVQDRFYTASGSWSIGVIMNLANDSTVFQYVITTGGFLAIFSASLLCFGEVERLAIKQR